MAARSTPPHATYADIEALAPNLVGELIAGTLYANPRPGPAHARAATAVTRKLGAFDGGADGPGGWIILAEPELHLGADVLVPDLGGWRRERLSEMPGTAHFEVAPDWVCEVLSPKTGKLDRTKKLPVYAQSRVGHVWLVDPIDRMLEVLRLDGETYRIVGTFTDDAKVRAEPFDAIELDLQVLWTW